MRAPAPAPALDLPVRPPAGAPHGAAAKPGGAPLDGAAGWAWGAPGDGWRAQHPWALSLPDPASPAGLAQPPAAPALSPWPGGAAPGPERWPADLSPHSDASDAASLSLVRRRAGPGGCCSGACARRAPTHGARAGGAGPVQQRQPGARHAGRAALGRGRRRRRGGRACGLGGAVGCRHAGLAAQQLHVDRGRGRPPLLARPRCAPARGPRCGCADRRGPARERTTDLARLAGGEAGFFVERSFCSGASAAALRARLPDLGGAAWGDPGGWGGGPSRALSPIGAALHSPVRPAVEARG